MTNILKERLDDCISTILKYPNLFGTEIDSLELISQYGKKPAWQTRVIDGHIFEVVELTFGIPTTEYEVRRIFTGDEVPNLIDFYKLQQEWMENSAWLRKFIALPVLMICLKCASTLGSISYYSGEGNQYPAVSITDFSIRPVRRTNIICEDEAISELLEKRPDLTN